MSFFKKVNIKIGIIISIFMAIILITNIRMLIITVDKAAEFTCEAQHREIISSLESTFEILKTITKKISRNEEIIEILENNRKFSDLNSYETTSMQNQIDEFEGILKSLTFVDTISISNIPGDYLFNKGVLYENFNVNSRPWFTEELINSKGETIISDIHKDYSTNRHTMAIVDLIYSKEDGSILGAAILDVYVEDLIKNINSQFYLGNLETYIKYEDDLYYSIDGIDGTDGIGGITIDDIEFSSQYYIKESNDILRSGLSMLFKFDKNSIVYSKSLKGYNKLQIILFITLSTILAVILILILKSTFKPIVTCIDKFKSLLKSSEEEDFDFENKDEFKQLEFISNALSKSFDNKIQSLIYYDELTELPNRKKLIIRTKELIDNNEKFALIFIDLNKFKQVNDFFGHLVGDELLKYFSNKLRSIVKAEDMVVRYSGDEFIILYTDYKDEKEIINFYENKIVPSFKDSVLINNNNIKIEFSAGVSVYPKDGNSLDELINKSDFMMYENKRNNLPEKKLLFFNDDIYRKIMKIETIKAELKNGVARNEFILYYQPIVDREMSLKKFEVLIRWKNEKLGFVSPIDFINYAEETGDIITIGYWIIEEVCKNYKELRSGYEEKLQVSINVSPIQLMETKFIDNIKSIIDKYNMDYKCMCFEITESVVLDGNSVVLENIKSLYELGIKIALDDFGTGYSSFSYLKKFKLDILKIDKVFIDDDNEINYEIVRNIRNIAHELNIDTVIEGVETLDQLKKLKEIGCDFFQGYYFSKPCTIEEIRKFLIKNKK